MKMFSPELTTHYVVGFMFSKDHSKVALIRKTKPRWQAGKLNGIGGKMEKDEVLNAVQISAMTREFKEEAGVETSLRQWKNFMVMHGAHNEDGAFIIHFFVSTGDLNQLKSMEEEKIEILNTTDVYIRRADMIDNLPWTLGMALDHL